MHFYQHEISRWALETQGLSLAHVGAYMRLVDRYLSTEKPIKTQWVSLAFGSDDARIANEVLAAFFEPAENPDEGWIHPEFAKELAAYQARAVTNKANGKRGGRPRKAKETESVSAGFSDESEGEAKKSLTQELNNSRTQIRESTDVLSAQAQTPYPEDFDQSLFDEAQREAQLAGSKPNTVKAEAPKHRTTTPRKKPATRCPFGPDASIPPEYLEIAQKAGIGDPQQVFSTFVNHALAHDRRLVIWPAGFRTWCSNELKWHPNQKTAQKPLGQRTAADYEDWLR